MVGSEVLVAVVGNVLSAAMTKAASGLLRIERRHAGLAKRLRGATPKQVDIQRGIDRLVRVIGNEGLYTTTVHDVLADLAQDHALTQLLYGAASQQEPTLLFGQSFQKSYSNRLKDSGISAEALASTLVDVVREVVFSDHKDPALAELLASQWQAMSVQLDAIAAALVKAEVLPDARYKEIRQKVCRTLAAQTKTIGVETTRGQHRVAISTNFVRSRLRKMGEDDFLSDIVMRPGGPDESSMNFSTFVSGFHRAVVVGDPGGGKSTLCQYLCNQFSQRALAYEKFPDRTDYDFSYVQVPIIIVLRSFEKSHESAQTSIFEYIVKDIAASTNENVADISIWLQQSLAHGHSVAVFDGLDEIMDVGNRRRYVKLVETFSDSWPSAPVLITTRKVGYLKAPLSDEFTPYELAPFDADEVAQYATKLIGLEKGLATDAARRESRKVCFSDEHGCIRLAL